MVFREGEELQHPVKSRVNHHDENKQQTQPTHGTKPKSNPGHIGRKQALSPSEGERELTCKIDEDALRKKLIIPLKETTLKRTRQCFIVFSGYNTESHMFRLEHPKRDQLVIKTPVKYQHFSFH